MKALRVWMLLLASGVQATLSGCCSAPPQVTGVFAWWDNHLHTTPDPYRNGAALPGLAGRVYLQDEVNKVLLEADGKLSIQMFDMTPTQAGQPPVPLVAVNYDAETLKRLKRTDRIGDGYTIFIPWETYNPAVKEVKLQLRYISAKGVEHYTNEEFITLKLPGPPPAVEGQMQNVVPALQQTTASPKAAGERQ